jgi:hypothetical protein
VLTKFNEIFLGYWPCHVFVLNQSFEDHLSHHHHGSDDDRDGPQNVCSVQTHDMADSLRRFHQEYELSIFID